MASLLPPIALTGCLAWFVASSLWIYPHSLSYFNESIGGPLNGPEHLLGSNGCGKGLARLLAAWCHRLVAMTMLLAVAGCMKRTSLPASVVVDAPVHDFGECHQGEELSHTFEVSNHADVPLEIIEAISSCRCIVAGSDAGLPDLTIAPHGTIRIPVRLHVGSVQGIADGRVVVRYRFTNVSSDSTSNRFFDLRLRAVVLADYRVVPSRLDFGEIDGLAVKQVSQTIRVVPEALRSLEIQDVSSDSAYVCSQVLSKVTNDPSFDIKVDLDVSEFTKSQSIDSSVILTTNSTRNPKLLVPVHAKYCSPVEVDPNFVIIRSNELGEVEQRLSVAASCPARIQSVDCSKDNHMRVEFDGKPVARQHAVRLFVATCDGKPLECELKMTVEMFPASGKRVIRIVSLPVYRFLEMEGPK